MSIETLTSAILRQMPEINKWQRDFFLHLLGSYLSLRGRYNYLNLARYGKYNEMTYRNHFKSGFDFQDFNRCLIEQYTGTKRMNVFDPSHISKSGKHTPGATYFWSGCAGKPKWGLELCGFAVVDVEQNTALHHFATQTMLQQGQGPMAYYCQLVMDNRESLLKMSPYLGVDAYFSKKTFTDTCLAANLHLISRLRNDAVLHYCPPPKQAGKPGRPKKYGDRFDVKTPDVDRLPCIIDQEEYRVYGGVVWVKSLKRLVKVAIVHELKASGQIKSVKIYFCTDLDFPEAEIWSWYKCRFQIEFLYRDSKQHVGLEHCQSRQQEALDFHFNMSLTTVSLAKVVSHLSVPKENRAAFSMADIKTQYFNELIINRVFDVFANYPNIDKNNPDIKKLYKLGRIAA